MWFNQVFTWLITYIYINMHPKQIQIIGHHVGWVLRPMPIRSQYLTGTSSFVWWVSNSITPSVIWRCYAWWSEAEVRVRSTLQCSSGFQNGRGIFDIASHHFLRPWRWLVLILRGFLDSACPGPSGFNWFFFFFWKRPGQFWIGLDVIL